MSDMDPSLREALAASLFGLSIWTEFLIAQVGAGAIDKSAAYRLLQGAADRMSGPTAGAFDGNVEDFVDSMRFQIDQACPDDWGD